MILVKRETRVSTMKKVGLLYKLLEPIHIANKISYWVKRRKINAYFYGLGFGCNVKVIETAFSFLINNN